MFKLPSAAILVLAPALWGQGIITTLAGNGACIYGGDGGNAAQANLCNAGSSAADNAGNLYFPDSANWRIRKISPSGLITTIGGNGVRGTSGDGGPAVAASIGPVYQVAVSFTGRVCFGDVDAHKIRCVNQNTGLMEGYGLGQPFSAGDGGPMSAASFRSPQGIALVERSQGIAVTEDIYISDFLDNTIRKIDGGTGIVSAVAGPGTSGVLGDGGPALSASLSFPRDLYNPLGSSILYVADSGNSRLRRIDLLTGIITTVAGNGSNFPSGDGGAAISAALTPMSITGDNAGNLYVGANNSVRKIDAAGIISTIAGNWMISGVGDDDVPSTQTVFSTVTGIGFDGFLKRLVITDYTRLRQIFFTPPTSTVLTTSTASPFVPTTPVTLQAAVTPATATGSVRFYQGGLLLGSAPLTGGTASFVWTPTATGSYGLRAVYGGDAALNLSSSTTVPVTVAQGSTSTTLGSSLNPALSGQTVTFTASVTPSAATGSVQFLDGATVLGTTPLAGGSAVLAVSNLASGSRSITASYLGSLQYLSSNSTVLTQVVKTATSTALGSSPNPSNYGGLVTLTATVSPTSATGTVQFFRGGTLVGSAVASGGVAQLTTSTLPGGVNSLTAVYGGDALNASSTSPAVSHTVNKVNSTTTLAANPSQSRVGQTVTFTATVAPAGATGTVLFFNGSTQIGSGTISAAGKAVFATSALPRGLHSIRANYQGDGNYNSSQSAIL